MGAAAPSWYLVESYGSKVDQDRVASLAGDTSAQLLLSVAVPADEVVFYLFEASSSRSVASACRVAGIPVHRLSAAVAGKVAARARDRESPDFIDRR